MGKATGFLEYEREVSVSEKPKSRIRHFREFKIHLPLQEQQLQGARCMSCGVPFCQSGMILGNMVSGCPLHNLIPEWNDLVGRGVQTPEKDEQLSGIYITGMSGTL